VTLTAGTDLSAPLDSSANAGKVVCLQDGTYSMQLSQHVAGIKVWALHQYQAKIYGNFVIWAPGSEWHGVYLNNGPNTNIGSPGPEVYADNFVFVDGIFTNGNTADGFYLGSDTYGIAHNVLIARNKIFNIGRPPGGTGADHPFYPATASGNITDNWLWGNLGFGMMFWPHSFSLTYAYNVVDGQQQADILFATTGANCVASRNIVVNNPTGVDSYQQTGAGAEVDDTWFWNVGLHYSGSGYAQGGGDGGGDPQFVDAANHNYNLKTGSPAAGYGPRVTLP
jgi:hypothetical protein